MNWYAIYTKPKAEDSVSQQLMHAGIEVYNPKLTVKKYARNKYRDVIESLFPCYIFGKFEPQKHAWMINYTRGVRKVVGSVHNPWPVSDEIIECIRHSEKDGFITVNKEEIKCGDILRIADGPLAGLTGIFKNFIKGSERVLLLLNAIGYQARAIVERASLVKVC